MTVMQQGLTISGLGIAITFLALSLLIGLIYLLEVVFRALPSEDDEAETSPRASGAPERAVAIAVAAWYFSQRRGRSLGDRLTRKRSAWWHNG